MVMVFGNLLCFFLLCINLLAILLLIERLKTGELGKRALIVTNNKEVYNLNENLYALESRDKNSTLYLKKIKDLCGKDIKTFAYGMGSHILALTNGGEVKSC